MMQKRTYHIDFSKKIGKIKPVHGTNLSFLHNTLGDEPIDSILSRHKPSFVGLLDVNHPYGQNQYVDIHCIFPDFSKDSNDESAYNFAPTDEYISKIRESGAEIIFRLGESRDSFAVKPFLNPPIDIEKWTDVALHIIMHFNGKWANGYKWNIKYFEIWSSPDTKNGFLGDVTDYIKLYSVCAKKIKEAFPRVKVGGYSSLGFTAMNRVTDNSEALGAYPFMQEFFAAITKKGQEIPFDFFTWGATVASAEELSLHSKYAKSVLKDYGVRSAKSIISEFDLSAKDGASAAEYLSAMITAQKCDVDAMLYKHSLPCEEKQLADAVFSAAFGGDFVPISEDYRKELYALAASHSEHGSVVISSTAFFGAVEMLLTSDEFSSFDITELARNDSGAYSKAKLTDIEIKNGRIAFGAKKSALYILTLK